MTDQAEAVQLHNVVPFQRKKVLTTQTVIFVSHRTGEKTVQEIVCYDDPDKQWIAEVEALMAGTKFEFPARKQD
jgi:hypothetical protein